MPKASWVSVVEDDRFFRESMSRLIRSLGLKARLSRPRLISSHPLVFPKPLV
jgi:FixJ family two-component response regulator